MWIYKKSLPHRREGFLIQLITPLPYVAEMIYVWYRTNIYLFEKEIEGEKTLDFGCYTLLLLVLQLYIACVCAIKHLRKVVYGFTASQKPLVRRQAGHKAKQRTNLTNCQTKPEEQSISEAFCCCKRAKWFDFFFDLTRLLALHVYVSFIVVVVATTID